MFSENSEALKVNQPNNGLGVTDQEKIYYLDRRRRRWIHGAHLLRRIHRAFGGVLYKLVWVVDVSYLFCDGECRDGLARREPFIFGHVEKQNVARFDHRGSCVA